MEAGGTRPDLTFVTSTELLDGLRATSNETLWRSYSDRYRPLLVATARRLGLSEDDAEDVAQQTLVGFCTALREGKYDRDRGGLRAWLFGIAHNQVSQCRRRNARHIAAGGADGDQVEQIADRDRMVEIWEQEWRDAVVRQCLAEVRREVRPHTFEAFQLLVSEQWPAARAAEHLGMSENAVFLAKHRIVGRVRELVPLVEELF